MWNSDIMEREIPMPISQNYHILCKRKNTNKSVLTVMAEINEEEEKLIDEFINSNSEIIKIIKGDREFTINRNNIYCYGEVNFRDKSELDIIDRFKFLNHLDGTGLKVYSNYNYETHSCKSPKKYALQTETWSPSFIAKFAHAALNKPKRIILFDI